MNYAQIRKMDISDGEGIRVGLYVSGCSNHCFNCYNQEAQSYTYGQPFTPDTFSKIISYLSKPYISGLSLLGGDPLWQDEEGIQTLISLCINTHNMNKNVWIWSGFTWEEIFAHKDKTSLLRQTLITNCDVFIDGPYIDSKRNLSLAWRGSENQRVIDIQKSLKENKIILYEKEDDTNGNFNS